MILAPIHSLNPFRALLQGVANGLSRWLRPAASVPALPTPAAIPVPSGYPAGHSEARAFARAALSIQRKGGNGQPLPLSWNCRMNHALGQGLRFHLDVWGYRFDTFQDHLFDLLREGGIYPPVGKHAPLPEATEPRVAELLASADLDLWVARALIRTAMTYGDGLAPQFAPGVKVHRA